MSRVDIAKNVQPQKIGPPPVNTVLEILEQLWKQGTESAKIVYEEPLDGLIETVLSQNTNDRNRDMAFERLKEIGAWNKIARLSKETIAEAIKPAGICNNKAATIQRVLKKVKEDYGVYSLKMLKKGTPDEAWEFMTHIQGVGPKTAACVLAFDLGFPAFPVDTHVARICKRLGWAEDNESPAEIQSRLETIIPTELKTAGHLNFIQHGKNICKARSPQCCKCPLRGLCPSSNC